MPTIEERALALVARWKTLFPTPGDPLAEVADEIHVHRLSLEQALAKRGLKLVEAGDA